MDQNKIFEDKYDQKATYRNMLNELMDEEQMKRADFYQHRFEELKAEKEELKELWIEIQDAFKSDRSVDDTGREIPFVNVMTPNIEGQLAQMTERKVKASIGGKGISSEAFAKTLEPVSDTIFRENKIRRKLKKLGRRYLMYGNTYGTVYWNKDQMQNGMPEINTPLMTNVLIDGKIKDYDDIDQADYCIEEVGSKSIMWARREFGDKYAEAIELGEELAMDATPTQADERAFTYLRVWTKNNKQGNLQLIKMTSRGLILEESDPSKPFYKWVNNKYPVFAIDFYPVENEIHGFGDGKLLLPIQQLINRLYDEVIIAVKFSSQGRTYADPKARMKVDEFQEADPSKPIIANNPNQLIKTEKGVGINQVVFKLLEQIFQKVQEVTRFSHLMIGQKTGETMTATQSSIQMQQGNTGVQDKQIDLSRMMSDMLEYALGLTMQFWTTEQAFRIANVDEDEKRKYAWVNPSSVAQVPIVTRSTKQYRNSYLEGNPDGKAPDTMILTDDEGKVMKKNIELDVEVHIGEGMPRNKMSLYNMVLQLSQIQIIDDKTGQPRSLFTYDQVKDMMEDILGIRIKDSEGSPMAQMPNGQQMPLKGSANMEGVNVRGDGAIG